MIARNMEVVYNSTTAQQHLDTHHIAIALPLSQVKKFGWDVQTERFKVDNGKVDNFEDDNWQL